MGHLAVCCKPEKISLGVTRTDLAYPSAMVNEICTSLTLLTFLPPSLCPNLREIELYFDVRGEDTEERLMRALVGTREHWKWIDTKFSSTLPALKMLTIRLEDNSVDATIGEDDKSSIREEIRSDDETGEGL